MVQPPIYAGILALAGNDAGEIARAVPTGYLATVGLSSVYLPYLTFMRNKFNTRPYEQEILPELIKN